MKQSMKDEVNRFRSGYIEVENSFDELERKRPELLEIRATYRRERACLGSDCPN